MPIKKSPDVRESTQPRISMIAALGARTRALGKDGALLWRIPEDLKRFKRLTQGHAIIMGRKTFESIGHALPDRTNIIVTRNPNYAAPGCIVSPTPEAALEVALRHEHEEVFIIGGGEIFKELLPATSRLYLTLVEDDAPGDTFFPDYSAFGTTVMEEKEILNDIPATFVIRER